MIGRLLRRLQARLGLRPAPRTLREYWRDRADRLGAMAVVNTGYGPEELAGVTARQWEVLLPLLRSRLRGDEAVALDFGCGPGRFTADLAAAIGGRAIGVDPVPRLLELAPASERVEYRLLGEDGRIPVETGSVDVAFVCLVLGGIVDAGELRAAVAELERVLRPGGLVFLVENTTDRQDAPYWAYRSAADYAALFPFARLEPAGSYAELGETITVLAGRADAASG